MIKYNSVNYIHNQERAKEYYLKNKKRIQARTANNYKKNIVAISLKGKEHYQINKTAINEKDRIRRNNKRKTDINFKILCNLRSRIWNVLKGVNKSKTTRKLLGCSIEFLKQYLASKFTQGMSFSNYGKWHVDHIRPCTSFDLSKVSEQSKCFHYTNLQPLWAIDNLKKHNKIRS
jgi:hypothetical protein